VYDPSLDLLTPVNLLALAKVAVPICDTTLLSAPESAGELSEKWNVVSVMQYATGEQPQCCFFRDDADNGVIVIAGLGAPRDFQFATVGSLAPISHPKIAGTFNAYAITWYNRVETWASSLGLTTLKTLAVVGHSMGGTIAPLLCKVLQQQARSLRVACFTAGSPRFTDRIGANALSSVYLARMMNYGDVVPAVPPTFTDAPNVYPILTGPQALAWFNAVHLGGGIQTDANGRTRPGITPLGYGSPLTYDLRTMWQAFQAASIPAHAMQSYANVLTANVPIEAPLRLHGIPTEPAAEPAPPPKQFREIEQAGREHIRTMSAAQTRVPASRASRVVKIKRINRRYFVFVNNTSFYSATSKRDARGVAQSIRHFMRQYLQNPSLFPNPEALPSLLDGAGL